mgnify:CR=1 FL=1
MAVDQFLKLDGIKGEAQDKDHKDQIDVLAWSFGVSQSGTTHMGAGGGGGKASVQDISFTKYIDKSSTELMKYCINGDHIKDGTLIVRKAGGKKPLEYYIIKMTDVIVTSVSTGGSGGEDRLTENVTLNFAKLGVKYTPQKVDGAPDSPLDLGWDIAANAEDGGAKPK